MALSVDDLHASSCAVCSDGYTPNYSGTECLPFGTSYRFELVDGGVDRECRGSHLSDKMESYYVLHVGVDSIAACKDLCLAAVVCKGIEYSKTAQGRCEVWSRTGSATRNSSDYGGIGTSYAKIGSTCLRLLRGPSQRRLSASRLTTPPDMKLLV